MSTNPQMVFLVLRFRVEGESPEVQGIFSTLDAAKVACREWFDVIMVVELNREYPQERVHCCDAYHPASGSVKRAGTTEWVKEEAA